MYPVAVGVVGDIKQSLIRIGQLATPHQGHALRTLRDALITDMNACSNDMTTGEQQATVDALLERESLENDEPGIVMAGNWEANPGEATGPLPLMIVATKNTSTVAADQKAPWLGL